MPLLHPKDIWARSGRWDDKDVKEIMYQFKDIHGREFGLSFTHEEIVMDLLGKFVKSYKDLPVKVYQFSTKFRNELRAKSGILRGREFLMKDLYSAHASEEDMYNYYDEIKALYAKIFKRIGLNTKTVEASGGVFTDKQSHEFQVICQSGEDTIFYCDGCDFAQNKEIFEGDNGDRCFRCGGIIKAAKSIEVGNIFPLGTKYSKTMKVFYKDVKGQDREIWFASYGIGPTRVMGTLVEVYHDNSGIIWPKSVAPYRIHLIGLDLDLDEVKKEAERIYGLSKTEGLEILFDDRVKLSAGEKFADADLIGIPTRVVVSKRNNKKLEVKEREVKETEFLTADELLKKLSN